MKINVLENTTLRIAVVEFGEFIYFVHADGGHLMGLYRNGVFDISTISSCADQCGMFLYLIQEHSISPAELVMGFHENIGLLVPRCELVKNE